MGRAGQRPQVLADRLHEHLRGILGDPPSGSERPQGSVTRVRRRHACQRRDVAMVNPTANAGRKRPIMEAAPTTAPAIG